jgi:signal transduction histidine kinase
MPTITAAATPASTPTTGNVIEVDNVATRFGDHVVHSDIAAFIEEAKASAELLARANGCTFVASEVDPLLGIYADRDLIMAAVFNLLQNAFKFTHPHTHR